MPSITITGSDASTGTLTLSDNGSTDANRGQIVTWVVNPNSGVSAITAINNYEDSIDVFNPDPAALGGNSKNWQGTVNPSLVVPPTKIETYYINWTDASGGTHTYDPMIRVNS
jgi:hypothetical protein